MHHDLQRRNGRLQCRHGNIAATSIQFGFVLLFATSAKLCFGQAALSSSAPQNGNTSIRTPHSLNPKPDAVENRFWHLLSWQNHLDQAAAEHEKHGKDGRWLRDYVQNRLGVETDQFAPVHVSAQRLTEALQEIDKHVRTILYEERTAGVQLYISTSTDSDNGSQLHQLTLDRQQAIHDEIARLRDEMGPDAFERLDVKLVKQTVQQPQNYYRRTDEAARFSDQWNTARSALLRGVALVEGAVPGTGDQRDLMAESCLDDEFNPGSCDLDVGASVAIVPNSEEIDAFAFSDMSPDYMGYYNVWPGVEMNLFQGGDDIDANRADGPDGNAMRNVSDPISTGAIYTGVATLYTCYYNANGGKECDPVWNNQVAAVESTATPSISSLSPPSAIPGSSGTLTINGDNLLDIFDPAGQPQVTSSGSSVMLSSPPAPSPASTSVQVNYSIAVDARPGPYDVTVSNNWGTSNAAAFTVDPGATVQSQNKAASQPATTISPLVVGANCSGEVINPTRIVWYEGITFPYPAGDIECTTTNVMAGQQIYIYVPPYYLTGSTWAVPTNVTWTISDCSDSTCATKTNTVNAVGGYTASAASGTVKPITQVPMNQNPITFYFTVPGHYEEVDVTGTFTDGTNLSAWARFNVNGPTGTLIPTESLQTTDSATVLTNPTNGSAAMQMQNSPRLTTAGVVFIEPASLPSTGKVIWVQKLKSVTYSQLVQWGAAYTPPNSASNQLDGVYPYPNGNPAYTTNDSPNRYLYSLLGDATESFDATMYALWDPALPAGCTPANTNNQTYQSTASTCTSIPIPLGSIRWRWSACAINQGIPPNSGSQTSPSWVRQCGPGFQYSGQSNGYPEWSSCSTSQYGSC